MQPVFQGFMERPALTTAAGRDMLGLLKHREDLRDSYSGGEPASVWQWTQINELISLPQAITGTIIQCFWVDAISKPTSLLALNMPKIKHLMALQP